MRLYRLAAKQGLAGAMCSLAKALNAGEGCAEDQVLAVTWMRRATELGDANAHADFGWWYMQGGGSPLAINYTEALRLLRVAAAQGVPRAVANIGVIFANGAGVPCDSDEACKQWRLAVELNFEPAKEHHRVLARSGHEASRAAVRELRLGQL